MDSLFDNYPDLFVKEVGKDKEVVKMDPDEYLPLLAKDWNPGQQTKATLIEIIQSGTDVYTSKHRFSIKSWK